jgi:CTP:phosphocholine cytidylyltransferase-like protein
MNQAINIIQIEESVLKNLIKASVAEAIAEQTQNEQMLNIGQICERTGMSRYTFNTLKDKHNIKCVAGKFCFGDVKKAMQT